MAEEFEFREMRDAVFWGVDLQGATFRDVDLSGACITHSRLDGVTIDADVARLVVNGVDVTDYVNEHDPWFELRSKLRPTTPADVQEGRRAVLTAWSAAIQRARQLPDDRRHFSVDGEWSFVQTVRHLVFATDKWFTVAVTGGAFHPIGLPNTGSTGFGWPGVDLDALPTFDETVAVWEERMRRLGAFGDAVDHAMLDTTVDVLENGPTTVHDCIGVVFEEHFQHLRYALRDLDQLG